MKQKHKQFSTRVNKFKGATMKSWGGGRDADR